MHRLPIVLTLVVLLAACTQSATPDPNQVSQLVQQAVQATLAAQPTELSTVVATAAPATSMPLTATPAPATLAPTNPPVPATSTSAPSATPAPTDTPTVEPTPTATRGPEVITTKAVNVRAGPGTIHPVLGTTKPGQAYAVLGRNGDGSWYQIQYTDERAGWIAVSVASISGDKESVAVAQNIPTPPPTLTPAPKSTAALQPTAPTSQPAVVQRPGLHVRQTIGSWEIQAERVQNEKAVYWYGDATVAMGRYAIVFVLAKSLAPGTQDMASRLAPRLRDDKGRIYDYSRPLTTERMAMLAACWEFSVGKTVFDDIDPGVETPLLMLWDVHEDVQSLSLILTDGRNKVEWDLGDFANIPPYKPQ